MTPQARVTLFRFAVIFSVVCVVSCAAEAETANPGISPRMPMHKTDGIFDLVSLHDVTMLLQKLMKIPLQILGRAAIPLLELPYHTLSTLWSWVGPGTTVPGMTPMGARSLTTGLFAGVISRILNADLVDLYMKVQEIEETCHPLAACEIGAYIVHQNPLAAPILHDVFEKLIRRTTKHWKSIQRGLKGGICHNYYPSCKKQFFMSR